MSKRLLTFHQLLAWKGQVGRKGENICLNLPGRGPAGLVRPGCWERLRDSAGGLGPGGVMWVLALRVRGSGHGGAAA